MGPLRRSRVKIRGHVIAHRTPISPRTNCETQGTSGVSQSRSLRGSSDAACRCHYCSNLLCLVSGKDACKAGRTHDGLERKGDVDWPATMVGSRIIVRCPYAYARAAYAHRDCVLSASVDPVAAQWTRANVTECPYSPFRQGVDRLVNFMVCAGLSARLTMWQTWQNATGLRPQGAYGSGEKIFSPSVVK